MIFIFSINKKIILFEYMTKNDKITTIIKGSDDVVRKKKKLRVERVIIVCVIALVIGFGLYKGITWAFQSITSLLTPDVQEEVVEPEIEKPKNYIATVVIDPGHGDWDPGANVGNVLEKDISLTTSKAIEQALDEANIKAVLTRETDISLSDNKIDDLKKRAAKSAENNANYFVSIHVNSFDESDEVSGFEIYKKNDESHSLAQNIGKNIETLNYSKNRGILDGGKSLQVLRDNMVPSVLIELGYLNNDNDYSYLSNDEKLQEMGKAIAKGIIEEVQTHLLDNSTQNNINK
ncbi:N-acetylmuramoyl-L-alanine amidase family protein [Massilimicrobiota timonensis]|uniref:N-acetylmuramoyl-L-alanine amidase family protein n=1 Tax=Massilimicrobiota timonensis TaxID=1776392 RepID=UPI001F1561E3|nr:N-acetylmuramoyl-L-alanine amidase [Massilimicrobiota timonensis]